MPERKIEIPNPMFEKTKKVNTVPVQIYQIDT
jgi:hypothetical protein